jgi:hypothetical protein
MKSFDGKSKTTQHKIAHDINNLDTENDFNIFDRIQGYCADLASVGDGAFSVNHVNEGDNSSSSGVNAVFCSYCSKPGHEEKTCRRKANSSKSCTYCLKKFHSESECHRKKNDLAREQPLALPTPSGGAGAVNKAQLTNPINPNQPANISHGGLMCLLQQLQQQQPQGSTFAVFDVPVLAVSEGTSVINHGCVALSLCDGMGCLSLVLKKFKARPSRVICVESEEFARVICQNVNPADASIGFPGVDHGWHNDVFEIKESDVEALGSNAIGMLAWGAPCEDMSRLRLLRSKAQAATGKDPRPGLDGPRGAALPAQCRGLLLHKPLSILLAHQLLASIGFHGWLQEQESQ